MPEAGVYIRSATPADAKQIRTNITHTMTSPDGRGARKRYEDAAARNEILVVERYDPRERTNKVVGFLEWHTRVDGTATIRDAGTVGDEPQSLTMKRLIREYLSLASPSLLQVKVRDDLSIWNSIFEDIPGFSLEGREFSRPHWKNIWVWSKASANSATKPASPRGKR